MQGQAKLIARVEQAAESALRDDGVVAPVDVMLRLGWLLPMAAASWRRAEKGPLRSLMQVRDESIATALAAVADFAHRNALVAVESGYRAGTLDARALAFTDAGDDDSERPWRTHWAREEKAAKVKARLEKTPDIVVVDAHRFDWSCAQCLGDGAYYVREGEARLCLACADLDHLVFLPAGNAALSRRAKAASKLAVVVMRFRRSRNRWERQGILAEEDAIAAAEAQCLDDADARAARAEREEAKRKVRDVAFAALFADAVRRLFPQIPIDEADEIAGHASVRGSGRVGRSAAGRALDDEAVTLAVVASIRHRHTEYDALMMRGVPRDTARAEIRGAVDAVLAGWRGAASGARP